MIIVPKRGLYLPPRFVAPKRQAGNIRLYAATIMAATGGSVVHTVALGVDINILGADTGSPFDARSGYRHNFGSRQSQHGICPGTGGAVIWANARNIITPPGFTPSDFEAEWNEISQTGAATRSSPFAEVGFNTWNTTRTWEISTTTVGLKDWVLDVTLREIADVLNTDTIRLTLQAEGII